YVSASVTKVDTAPPSGGSVLNTNGYVTSTSVPITLTQGSDPLSGIAVSGNVLQRASTTLSGGVCGATYSGFSTIVTDPALALNDTTVVSGNCYKYQYIVKDGAGNTAAPYTNPNVAKIDTAKPSTSDN